MKVRSPQQGGMPGNMSDMLKKAQKMQEEMAEKQAELEEREYEVSAGGGAITLKINGKRQVLALDIQPDIVDPDDVEMLSDALIAAINEAIKKVDTVTEEEMGKISGQMGLPGMF